MLIFYISAYTGSLQNGGTWAEEEDREPNIGAETDDKTLQQIKDRIAKESAKGAATRNQQALWDRILEMRILLQKSMTSSHQLPRLSEVQAVRAVSPGCSSRLDAFSQVDTFPLLTLVAVLQKSSGSYQGP